MTHLTDDQRWIAIPAEHVTEAVLAVKGDPRVERRFRQKVDYGFEADDCHIWTGALSDEGYGTFRIGKHNVRAHRVSYIWNRGVPEMFLDHVNCIGRFCVNENHLEDISNQENSIRAQGHGRLSQRHRRYEALTQRNQLRHELQELRESHGYFTQSFA